MAAGGRREEHTLEVRPAYNKRFPKQRVQELLREVLHEHLGEGPEYDKEMAKNISEAIRDKLKELGLPRYKFVVNVAVGQQQGAGVRAATRCLWDAETDNYASESFVNDSIFVVATAYGIYLY